MKIYDFIWIVIILIILIGVFVYIMPEYKLRKLIVSEINNDIIKDNNIWYESLKTHECPSGIIPEEIEMTQSFVEFYTKIYGDKLYIVEGSHATGYNNSKTNWADGQIIELLDFAERKCHQGQFEGENINLVYCNDLKYSSSKIPISDDGTIGKTSTISLSIDLILKKEKVEILIIPPIALGSAREVPIITYKVISATCKQ